MLFSTLLTVLRRIKHTVDAPKLFSTHVGKLCVSCDLKILTLKSSTLKCEKNGKKSLKDLLQMSYIKISKHNKRTSFGTFR